MKIFAIKIIIGSLMLIISGMIAWWLCVILFISIMAYCLIRMAKDSNDDCMTDEGYNTPVIPMNPVETENIPWGDVKF